MFFKRGAGTRIKKLEDGFSAPEGEGVHPVDVSPHPTSLHRDPHPRAATPCGSHTQGSLHFFILPHHGQRPAAYAHVPILPVPLPCAVLLLWCVVSMDVMALVFSLREKWAVSLVAMPYQSGPAISGAGEDGWRTGSLDAVMGDMGFERGLRMASIAFAVA